MRQHDQDIAALANSFNARAGGALPIGERIQSSPTQDTPPVASGAAARAQRILGRGYAEGGRSRRYALALWLVYGQGAKPADSLELACVLVLTREERTQRAREWSKWGVGKGAEALTTLGVELLGLAIGWYQDADESEGHSGAFGALQSEADALHGNGGAFAQMRAEHERELARARAAKTKGRAA